MTFAIHGAVNKVITGIAIEGVKDISDGFPVNKVLGFQHRAAGHQMHGGAHHVKIVAYPYDIRIGDISPDNRVAETVIRLAFHAIRHHQ